MTISLKLPLDPELDSERHSFLDQAKGVIHVGANVGQEREIYANRGLPVVWIEPVPGVFDLLCKQIAQYPEQRAIQALITDTDGQGYSFHLASNGESSSIFPFNLHRELWPEVEYLGSVPMTGWTLKTILHREGIDTGSFDTLVIDVQGAELLVLRGAGELLAGFNWIKCEAADFESYTGGCWLHDLSDYLLPRGFARVELFQGTSRPGIGSYFESLYRRVSK